MENKMIDCKGKTLAVIVCGGRHFSDRRTLDLNLDNIFSHYGNTKVLIVSGHATGADSLGEQYAKNHGYQLKLFPADWDLYGGAAGPIRNGKMLQFIKSGNFVPLVVAFWDGTSRGTKDMIQKARNAEVNVEIVRY